MDTLDLFETSEPQTLPTWLPPIAGGLAAILVASFMCRLPILHSISFSELIGSSVECVLAVLLASSVTVWAICAISPRPVRPNANSLILRTSLDTIWIAPLVLLIRQNSPWAVVIAAVLMAGIVTSVRLFQSSGTSDIHISPTLPPSGDLFCLTSSSSFFWRQTAATGAALCAQIAVGAAFAGYPITAAGLAGTSSAIWTWHYTRDLQVDHCWRAHPSRSPSRAVWIIALAIFITGIGLLRYLPHSPGIQRFGIPSRYEARQGFAQGERRGQPGHDKRFEGSVAPPAEGDPGVVLWPEKQIHTKLVAPAPIFGNSLLLNHRSSSPLVIPFDGVYWFFKAPDMHPPRTSRQAHGSPEMLEIRSTDRRPLSMEAHESLGSMIDMECCSKIQIAIRNADRYPDTVSMELVLINTSLRGKPSQSLGRMTVKSTRPWSIYDERPPASETLNFVLPAHTSIRRFDEVMVVFRLDAARADSGPEIAIDRFVLVPRGL